MWGNPEKLRAAVACPVCAGVWTVPARYAGRTVTCRACGAQALVPESRPVQKPTRRGGWPLRIGLLLLAVVLAVGAFVLMSRTGRL